MEKEHLDLKKALCDSIKQGTGLDVKPGFLLPVNQLGIVENPGSSSTTDMAGISTWNYNYSITIKTANRTLAANDLNQISDYLHGLNDLKSQHHTFIFNSINVSSAPSESLEDLKNNVTYSLDFSVQVIRKR
ncbi:minor capsid protein [Lactobacillus amylovorus]|uniref:minor capsid protein n=1 Tax=Lactobacillus amylovorus TaxID=1604 RepID=UPI00201DEAF8|nr:minor capsid protein [Lactobacillus amylovorus]